MTISLSGYEQLITGAGSTGPYNITAFKVYEAADVECVQIGATGRRTTLVNATDFTATLDTPSSLPSTVSVTTTSSIPGTDTLEFRMARSRLQQMDLPTSGKILNERFEQGLDTASMNHIGLLWDRKFRTDEQRKLTLTGITTHVTLDAAEENYPFIELQGSPGAGVNLIFPADKEHVCYVKNAFGDSSVLTVKSPTSSSNPTVAAGAGAWIYIDGASGGSVEELT